MLAFIDDSGDAGFKFGLGSSEFLVIACCIFESAEMAEVAARKIRDFRGALGWRQGEEFKFSKTRHELRLEFISLAETLNFSLRALVIDKRVFNRSGLSSNQSSFYLFAIEELLVRAEPFLESAKIRVDGTSVKSEVRKFEKHLKSKLNASKQTIESVRFVDSRSDQLIQLADVMAGLVRRSFEAKSKRDSQFSVLMKRFMQNPVSEVWEYLG